MVTPVAVPPEGAESQQLVGGVPLASLVRDFHRPMVNFARTMVDSATVAEEAVQEAWVQVLQSADSFEGRSSLRTWIFSILVNRARTRGAREARSVPFSALEAGDGPTVDPEAFGADGRWRSAPPRLDADPEARLLSQELRGHLLAAVEELAPAQRAVITLRDLAGLDAEEVCSLLDITDGNQRVLLHRARANVRGALGSLLGVEGV